MKLIMRTLVKIEREFRRIIMSVRGRLTFGREIKKNGCT